MCKGAFSSAFKRRVVWGVFTKMSFADKETAVSKARMESDVFFIRICCLCFFIWKIWLYKYTYTDKDKLKYTEEDGMETYLYLYKNNRYETGDYASDCVDKGFYLKFKNRIYLINEDLWLYINKDNTLKTEIKNGKEVMFDNDFYNVLVFDHK